MFQAPLYCVIMAGGIGSRFWPLSRPDRPKQFLDILGEGRTMIQSTYDRLTQLAPPERCWVLTGEHFADQVAQQLPDLPIANILTEPERRNTAPCLAYAAYKAYAANPNALMLVTPSDHHIGRPEAFLSTLRESIHYLDSHDALLTIGIHPTFPATSYGYIEMGPEAIAQGHGPIVRFKEKPDRPEAERLLATGRYVWNSGMFLWRVSSLVQALEAHLPEVAHLFGSITTYGTAAERMDVARAFTLSPSISIDYGVMERASNVHVVRGDFGWDDIGTWESLYRYSTEHTANTPHHYLVDSPHTLVRTTQEGKRVVVAGLDNYVVIDTADTLLIAPKGDEAALHALLKKYGEQLN